MQQVFTLFTKKILNVLFVICLQNQKPVKKEEIIFFKVSESCIHHDIDTTFSYFKSTETVPWMNCYFRA